MIVVRRKLIEDILEMTKDYSKILVIGCDGCAGIVQEGGKRQGSQLALVLDMKRDLEGLSKGEIKATTILRQCDKSIVIRELQDVDQYEVLIPLGCGVGIQTIAEAYPNKVVVPGVDTLFIGTMDRDMEAQMELCRACGDCILYETAGVCPVARCAKSLMNGPCGGVIDGMCEVGNYTNDCAWYLIYKRLKELDRLDKLTVFRSPRKHSLSHGAPRRFQYLKAEEAE